jgi:hypothetical protein
MAEHPRRAVLVALSACTLALFVLTGLRTLAQAPDRGDYSVGDGYAVAAVTEIDDCIEDDCFILPETDLAGGEALMGGPPTQVILTRPNGTPIPGSVGQTAVAAAGLPPGGTYTWSAAGPGAATFSPQGTATSSMSVAKRGSYTVTVKYYVAPDTVTDTNGTIVAIEADLQMDGLDEGDEEDPGVFLAVGGPRREATLDCGPLEAPPPPNPADPPHVVTHRLTLGHSAHLALYGAETGGDPLTVLSWGDEPGKPNNWGERPSTVWVEATGLSGEAREDTVSLTYTFTIDGNGAIHSDLIAVSCVSVDLDIDGIEGPNHETEEDDPGGFMALGGSRKKILLSATPDGAGPLALEATEGADKVDIYEGPTGGDPLTGQELAWTTAGQMPSELWVEPTQIGGPPGDIELKLSFDPTHAYDAVILTVCELQSLTRALIPANRERTTLGIGEPVLCFVHPFVVAHWECVGPGMLEPDDGDAEIATFTASQSPSSSSVHATVGDLEFVLDFDVIPPNGMGVVWDSDLALGTPGPPDNSVGARSVFAQFVQPMTVSFHWAQFRENIPETTWIWPDGSVGTFAAAVVPWGVEEGNVQIDTISSALDPIGRLWNGQAYVPFTWTVPVPEEYLNEAGQWVHWLAATGPAEYSGTDQSARVGRGVPGHTEYGGWQGPWQE